MKVERPKPSSTIRVIARDEDGGEPSRSFTVYDTTPDVLIPHVKRLLTDHPVPTPDAAVSSADAA